MIGRQTTTWFWLGVGLVAAYGWWTLPVVNHPLGSDWGHYFTAAEYIWDPVDGIAYPDFRKPWFGWLIGGLGQAMGYLDAAQWVSRMSMLVMVASAAGLGWALSNRWCGLVAAAAVPLMPLVMDGALWVNHYPLLSAAVGMAFAAGSAAVRWRQTGWFLLAGLSAGAAWALDMRGGIALAGASALVVLAALRCTPRAAAARLMVFGAAVAMILAHAAWLERAFDVPQLAFEQQLEVQRKGTLEQIRQGLFDDRQLQEACANETVGRFTIGASATACGEALRLASYRRLSALQLLPLPATLAAMGVMLVPYRRKRNGLGQLAVSTAAAAVVLGAPAVSLWAGMGWVTYFDRYVMPFAVLFAAAVPIAAGRVVSWIPRCPAWLGAVGALVWVIRSDPGLDARSLDSPELAQSSEYHAGEFARWAAESVGPDDRVLDCAGLAVDSLLLPNRIDYTRFPPGDPECVSRLRAPDRTRGTLFLITMHRDIPPHLSARDLPFNADAVRRQGYEPVEHDLTLDGYRLWRRR
ncbi:MAG: hypothetical protein VX944_01385 [Myxococcota bacterium]|nr:hypothetical protein [Myxococcota bacterium]